MIARKIVGAALLVLLPAAHGWACTKTVRWFDDAPYSFQGKDGNIVGVDADLARAALRLSGCRANFVQMPWARALIELERGKLDVLPGAFRSPEREHFAHFSIPLPQSANVLYLSAAAAKKYHPATLEELAGTPFRLGVQIGVAYGDSFLRFKTRPGALANLVPITLRCNGWKMVELGRIDGMIADEASAAAELKQLQLDNVVLPSRVTVSTDTAMFAFSKATSTADFVARFNKALATLTDNGQYRKLRERYLRQGGLQNACMGQPAG